MNLQIEKIDGHQARLTVALEPKRFEDAKRKAARKISRQVNIRGFRKGKAPYKRIAQLIGESAIIEEAFDDLLQPTFKSAIDQSGMFPPGMGSLEETTTDPPTMQFVVPIEPTVDLGDWRDLRLPWEAPTVDESAVEEQLRRVQLMGLEVVNENPPESALGHRVYIDVESGFVDAEDEEPPDFGGDEEAEEAYYTRGYVEPFATEKNTPVILDPNEDPFMDGFVENLVGATVGSDRTFALTIPDDDADESIRGREVEFQVTINAIEEVSIPELDEDFLPKAAELLAEDEFEDMAALRDYLRESLERSRLRQETIVYSEKVMNAIAEGADVRYPEVAVENMSNTLVNEFAQDITQRGMNFEDYLRMTGSDRAGLASQLRETAIQRMERSLLLGELLEAMDISATEDDIVAQREAYAAAMGVDEALLGSGMQGLDARFEDETLKGLAAAALAALGRGDDIAAAVEDRREAFREDAAELRKTSERLQARREAETASETDEIEAETDELAADADVSAEDDDGDDAHPAADRPLEKQASPRPIKIERRARKA